MKRKVEAVLDPFSGLDELPVGPSLLRDDEEEESVYGEGEVDVNLEPVMIDETPYSFA